MTDELTVRSKQVLKLVIEEYIVTAKPVGSGVLREKYRLPVSPATLRNEMAELSVGVPHTPTHKRRQGAFRERLSAVRRESYGTRRHQPGGYATCGAPVSPGRRRHGAGPLGGARGVGARSARAQRRAESPHRGVRW
ncbi:MAG: hypothetical protein WKH64_05365 [Chloroflexia bacterium]